MWKWSQYLKLDKVQKTTNRIVFCTLSVSFICTSVAYSVAYSATAPQLNGNNEKPVSKEQDSENQNSEKAIANKNETVKSNEPPFKLPVTKQELQDRLALSMSKHVYKRFERVQIYMSQENYNEAFRLLRTLLELTANRPDDHVQIRQSYGLALAQTGKYDEAIDQLQKSLETNVLPADMTLSTLMALAQLHSAQGHHRKTYEIMMEWFRLSTKPVPEAYILLAMGYSELGAKDKALAAVEKAIGFSTNPQENWLNFAVALNYELKNYAKCIKLLQFLTSHHPDNANYWKQLAGNYLNIDRPDIALSTLQLAHKAGHIKEEVGLLNIAGLYLQEGLPIKAAQLIETGLKSGEIKRNEKTLRTLSDSYLLAQEKDKALITLGQAAKLAKKGDLYAQQGQLYMERAEWDKAITAFRLALKKGQLKNPGSIWLAMAVSQYEKGQMTPAIETLAQAKKYKSSRKTAVQWIDHIQAENQFRQSLETL